MEILHAPDVMGMEDAPTSIAKEKGNTSMAIGLKALAEGRGDAFVSAGARVRWWQAQRFLSSAFVGCAARRLPVSCHRTRRRFC